MRNLLSSRRLRKLVSLLLLAWTAACGSGGAYAHREVVPVAAAPVISRTLLDHYDLPDMPGWETRLYLVEYAPGAGAPVHHHPVEGLGYVVSGRFESAFTDERPTIVEAGHAFRERALVPHTLFRNPDSSRPLKFVIAFVVRHGATVVEAP